MANLAGSTSPIPGLPPIQTPVPGSQATMEDLPLAADPAYLAFLRSSGLSQQQAAAAAQAKATAINAALQATLPGMARDDATAQRNLAGSQESRGMLASGEYLRNSSELADRQSRAQQSVINNAAMQVADLGQQLASNVAAQQRQAAEQGAAAASKVSAMGASPSLGSFSPNTPTSTSTSGY